jgi:AcrR family transcriptional regulator
VSFAHTIAARSSRAHGRRTLGLLLEAAVAELAEHGYHGARMSRIARRAGTAHGTLYVYFADKADLLDALYEDAGAELQPLLMAMPPLEDSDEGHAALHLWLREVCGLFVEHGAVLQALTESMDDDSAPAAGRAALRLLARTSARIAERIAAARPAGLDPEIAALAIWALVEGATASIFRGELHLGLDELADGLAELLLRSVFGAGTMPRGG